MNQQYSPPYSITSEIVTLVAEISQQIGRLSEHEHYVKELRLNRINRIRTIQGTLGIEGNTLSQEQITAILDEKHIIGPRREIQEARNAIKAYDQIEKWNSLREADLLSAHTVLMTGLMDAPGRYRTGDVGIMGGTRVVHMAPPAGRIPSLMDDLFNWLNKTNELPLISSSVFHYEFEFIHPFDDGNGRLGRLWQNLILSRWNTMFLNLPVESLVFEHQQEYYSAINQSTKNSDSAKFIEFILSMIVRAFQASLTPEVTPKVTPEVIKMLNNLNREMSRVEIQSILDLKDEKHFRLHYLKPALEADLIEMTIPDKPKSRLQKYRLTIKGKSIRKKVLE